MRLEPHFTRKLAERLARHNDVYLKRAMAIRPRCGLPRKQCRVKVDSE